MTYYTNLEYFIFLIFCTKRIIEIFLAREETWNSLTCLFRRSSCNCHYKKCTLLRQYHNVDRHFRINISRNRHDTNSEKWHHTRTPLTVFSKYYHEDYCFILFYEQHLWTSHSTTFKVSILFRHTYWIEDLRLPSTDILHHSKLFQQKISNLEDELYNENIPNCVQNR